MAVKYHKVKETSYKLVTLVLLLVFLGLGAYMYFTRPHEKAEVKVAESGEVNGPKQVVNAVQGDFVLTIDKLGIQVPVIENVDGANRTAYDKALYDGVAHYKGTSLPGGGSNIFIFGHSSALDAKNQYGKIFEKMNDMAIGDVVSIRYKDKVYDYTVTEKRVVMPDELSVLDQTKKEQLTLMTCWPIGSNEKRLIVIAKVK